MAEISNNLLAGLLIVAIVISASSVFIIGNLGTIRVTGQAVGYGTANVTITGQLSIRMLRNVTNFGSSTLGGVERIIHTQDADNWNTFYNGSEGNGTDYGSGTHVYPFVVENYGNVNASINISAANKEAGDADPWISQGAGAYFKGKNNETYACGADWSGEFGEGSWTELNESETSVCTDLDYEQIPTKHNSIRIHFRLLIPGDTDPEAKGEVIDIGALQS